MDPCQSSTGSRANPLGPDVTNIIRSPVGGEVQAQTLSLLPMILQLLMTLILVRKHFVGDDIVLDI